MSTTDQIKYIIQVALVFLILSYFKSSLIYLFFVVILAIPFKTSRTYFIDGWQRLGNFNKKISSAIILSIIFYFFLTPLSFFTKLFEKKSTSSSTNWKDSRLVLNEEFFDKYW